MEHYLAFGNIPLLLYFMRIHTATGGRVQHYYDIGNKQLLLLYVIQSPQATENST